MATPIVAAIKREAPVYEPGRTLGRSLDDSNDYDEDRMLDLAEYLDALLCIVTDPSEEPGAAPAFQRFNESIRHATLRLASHLATELHEVIAKRAIDESSGQAQAKEAQHV